MSSNSATTQVQLLVESELEGVITSGAATGKINGINHLVIVIRDFERSLKFYRDVLGFKLITHTPGRAANPDDRTQLFAYDSLSFMRVADNVVLGLYECKHAAIQSHASTTVGIWPDSEAHHLPITPFGLDHISFNVPTWTDVLWFRDHLTEHGISVSQIFDYADGSASRIFDETWPLMPTEPGSTSLFRDKEDVVLSGSVYFYDPDGNALEVSTMDWTRPE
jgi:catechol 2,3-dioxygenase-like lactoylglutathione lyase family enzyme